MLAYFNFGHKPELFTVIILEFNSATIAAEVIHVHLLLNWEMLLFKYLMIMLHNLS